MVAAGSCIKFKMDAVEWWEGREGKVVGIIVVVNDVFNEAVHKKERVRLDKVIRGCDAAADEQ